VHRYLSSNQITSAPPPPTSDLVPTRPLKRQLNGGGGGRLFFVESDDNCDDDDVFLRGIRNIALLDTQPRRPYVAIKLATHSRRPILYVGI